MLVGVAEIVVESRLRTSTRCVNIRLAPLRRHWREFSAALLDAVLPSACSSCQAPGPLLCAVCRRNLVWRPSNGCRRCGAAAGVGSGCAAGHAHLRNLSQLMAPLRFAGTGGRMVRRFKLDGDASAGRFLVRAMADCYRSQAELGRPVVLSVPLHRARRRRRGFDQADWLARGLAARLNLRIASGALVRTRATMPQGDPRVMSRSDNVRGAFRVRDQASVTGRKVLLVDDVFTTGATARACAKLLREAGALAVSLLVACES